MILIDFEDIGLVMEMVMMITCTFGAFLVLAKGACDRCMVVVSIYAYFEEFRS